MKSPIRAFASADYLTGFYEFLFRFDRKHFETAVSNLISIDQFVLEDPEDAETLLIQLLQITKEIKARASEPQIQPVQAEIIPSWRATLPSPDKGTNP